MRVTATTAKRVVEVPVAGLAAEVLLLLEVLLLEEFALVKILRDFTSKYALL